MASEELDMRVVLFRDSECWLAQCVDHDFVAQGPTWKEAMSSFFRCLSRQIELDIEMGVKPLSRFEKALQEYVDMFEDSRAGYLGDFPDPLRMVSILSVAPNMELRFAL